jgi:hypothetical protein
LNVKEVGVWLNVQEGAVWLNGSGRVVEREWHDSRRG